MRMVVVDEREQPGCIKHKLRNKQASRVLTLETARALTLAPGNELSAKTGSDPFLPDHFPSCCISNE